MTTLLYAAGASLPLLFGAMVAGCGAAPVADGPALAAGALIAAAAFELFEPSYRDGEGGEGAPGGCCVIR